MTRHAIGRWKRAGRSMVSALAVVLLCVAVVGAASARAESPRWEVEAVSSPTDIKPSSPRNEVQKLTVPASGGTFTLELQPPASSAPQTTGRLPYNATAAEVQTALTSLFGVGGSGVTVTGGPASSTPDEYDIEFQANNADVIVEPMKADSSNLTGGVASIVELARGANAPEMIVTATNVGGAATSGRTTLSDVVPPWMTVTSVEGFDVDTYAGLECQAAPVVNCSYEGEVAPGDQLIVYAKASVGASPPSTGANQVIVTGGGAAQATLETTVQIGSAAAPFGPAAGGVFAAVSSQQAGSHSNLTASFLMNTGETDGPVSDTKDVRFDLPPGLVGSTVGMPRCDAYRVIQRDCPSDTQVGVAHVLLRFGDPGYEPPEVFALTTSVYNIAPSPGEPAAFAFDAFVLPVRMDTSVLSDGNYGIRVTASDLAESAQVVGTTVTIWGVPAEHSEVQGQSRVPLLTNSQQCGEPLVGTMSADSWATPGVFQSQAAPMGSMTGCLLLPFQSSFSLVPDTLEASAPAGYTFDLNVPQRNTVGTLATSSMKDFELQLPEGVVVNPSAAWGLKACSDAQFYGAHHPSQEPALPAECPREAQIGEVEVETPDLEHPLKGQVFLGVPECDPCSPADAEDGKMVRLFVQLVGQGEAGVVVKFEGHGLVDQATGRITAVFHGTPQVPFSRLHFVLEGGPRAVLANPRVCGPVRADGDLTPWSSMLAVGEQGIVSDSLPFYELEINQSCFGPRFHPSLKSGSPNIQAGEYSPFTLAFGREDQDQFFKGISLTMPPGLLGDIGSVLQCKEPEASQGTCGAGSLIGHVTVLTGPGTDPFLVSGGQVFLTESYEGAPYGLSIVVPAVAGPYTLSGTTGQGTVVVRAKIDVDPSDAHLTVTSDPLPSMLDGIPLQLKVVNVTIDRPGFTFNPTNCGKLAIAASISSTEGMTAGVSSPFQVTNCGTLAFKPQFKVSTAGKTSKADGASLAVKLTYPNAPQGSQANIRSVKVDLPKQLPSRLTTLQKACTAAQFDTNPAGCPVASVVGHAKAITPILPVALEGPAYFVSHGGEAFPSLIVVLQGYGVTVDLVGTTFISKAGITSSTFKQVPDVPIGSFELTLPEGRYSALAANGNLCASKLAMPTAFVAQNGAEIHESTPIGVTGCAKAKPLTRAQKLARALKACKTKAKGKRAGCKKQARKRYGPIEKKAKKK
jgi:hypothetical protein